MSAGTSPILHPAHGTRRVGTQRIASIVAVVTRRGHVASASTSHAGQLGPVRETEFGRRSGARI
jgi:hypothetical protein